MKRKKWKDYLSVALCASMVIAGSNAQSMSGGMLQKLAAQGAADAQAVGSQTTEMQAEEKDGQNIIRLGDGARKVMTETSFVHYDKTKENVDTPEATKDPVLEMIAQNQEKESEKTVDPAAETEKSPVNEKGEVTEPFDQAYPDVFESGDVEYAANSIMLKMKASSVSGIKKNLQDAGIGKLERIFKTEDATWYTAYLFKGKDVDKVIEKVRAIKKVLVAEYNFKYETTAVSEEVAGNPKAADQWVLNAGGIQDSWKELKAQGVDAGGSSSVTVAVIDTGVDYNHEDLKDNIWKNTEEIPNDGIDNDGDGIVDDYYGADMVNGTGSAMDDEGHGTHVAGIIAASNNDKGVVGIAYNTKIMPIKAGDASGYFMQDNIAKAINYAYEKGADVINMSFGGSASSVAVQDALSMAYSRCVLVASAGNNGAPNEATDSYPIPVPNYPAALSYVMGVMSVDEDGVESGFSNWDATVFNNKEYEVYAPGEQILSTIPGDRYASLSGTSMAAPVVAAEAALLRSRYKDLDKYPTKFIYGQISGTADKKVTCANPEKHTVMGLPHNIPGMVNFKEAITRLPKPEVGMSDYAIFDTAGFSADTEGLTTGCEEINNGDGVVDAGETIALGLTLRNRWGMSKNTKVHLEAKSSTGEIDNPYVTFLNNDIDYRSVGTYSENDCGKLYGSNDEEWTGWQDPFYVKIDKNCPNNVTITIQVTVACENGLDETDTEIYRKTSKIRLAVRRGQVLPNKITEDTTLTKDNIYIIPNSMVVMEGATLTIEPGTKIQFWSSDAQDSYAENGMAYLIVQGNLVCKGTEEEMVELFPSEYMGDYRVEIYSSGHGSVDMEYTKVTNPYLHDIDTISNCEFVQNFPKQDYRYRYLEGGKVRESVQYGEVIADRIEDSSFYQLGPQYNSSYNQFKVGGDINRCIFVDSGINYGENSNNQYTNCVFYGNNNRYASKKDESDPDDYSSGTTSSFTLPEGVSQITLGDVVNRIETGATYVAFKNVGDWDNNVIKRFIEYIGLKTAVLDNKKEAEFLGASYNESWLMMDMTYRQGKVYDCTGKELSESIPVTRQEDSQAADADYKVYLNGSEVVVSPWTYGNMAYLAEVSGDIYITDIELDDYLLDIDLESTAQIHADLTPATIDQGQLIYESEDPSVAEVSDMGKITPKAQGTTNIKVYSPDKAVWNYVTVNVRETVELESISLKPEKLTLAVGDTKKLSTVFYPKNTTRRSVHYTTSNADVAVVDDRGKVTAKGAGTVQITATGDHELQAVAEITCVIPAEDMSFESAVYVTTLDQEDGKDFYPSITPEDSTDQELIWASSDEETAYVDDSGKLVKKKAGTVTLRATLKGTKLSADLELCILDQIPSVNIAKVQKMGDKVYMLQKDGRIWALGGTDQYPKSIDLGAVKDFYVMNMSDMFVIDAQGILKRYRQNYMDQDSVYHGEDDYVLDTNFSVINNVVSLNEGGEGSVYAVTSTGKVYAMGDNYYGQLGDGTTDSTPEEMTQVLLNAKVVKVVGFSSSALMLDEDGNVYTCGGWSTKTTKPAKIAVNAKNIYSGASSSYAYMDFGETVKKVYGGRNAIDGVEETYTRKKTDEVFYGSYDGCYYIENGKVYMRGNNSNGQFGNGASGYTEDYSDSMKNITDAEKVFWLGNTVYVQTESGVLYGVGQGSGYLLGNGSSADCHIPQRIPFGVVSSGDKPAVKSWNSTVTDSGESGLTGGTMKLTFNNRIIRSAMYNGIKVRDKDDNALAISKDMDMQYLNLTFEEELTKDQEYTLTIPAGALTFPTGEQNDEITITFIYLGAGETEDTGANGGQTGNVGGDDVSNPDASGDDTDVTEVHETQKDEELMAQRKKLTKEDVEEQWKQFVDEGMNTTFYSNAIINRLNNDDMDTWLRITAPDSNNSVTTIGLGGNYWGTTNQKLIDKQILDSSDFLNLAEINTGKILTEAPKDTYPFVTDAYLEREDKKVTEVGNDLVTFVVEFNRDMDTDIDLKVGFGSSYPYNDYTVEGKYETPTRWRGTIQLSTLIENGYQCWSVSNGKAAGTSLKLFKDWGRFPFKIDTSAAQALTMQGEATKTGIKLSWMQDDFDTLAGYNVYRSKTEDGQYSRLNKTVIPADTKEWFDDTIEPGEKYYYNFTVVKSDMTESEPSGKVSVHALDTMAPDIYHTPVRSVFEGNNLVISATISDNIKIESATLYYRVKGTKEWHEKTMSASNDKFFAVISADYVTIEGLEYYISATDGGNVTNRGTAEEPNEVLVQKNIGKDEFGDVDGNGMIELKDALMVLQAANDRLNLTEEQFARADWNQDGELSAMEALRILQFVNGSVSTIVP